MSENIETIFFNFLQISKKFHLIFDESIFLCQRSHIMKFKKFLSKENFESNSTSVDNS